MTVHTLMPTFMVREAVTPMPTAWGEFTIYGYKNLADGTEHVALVMGDPTLPGTLTRAKASTVVCTSITPGSSPRRWATASGARLTGAKTSAKWAVA